MLGLKILGRDIVSERKFIVMNDAFTLNVFAIDPASFIILLNIFQFIRHAMASAEALINKSNQAFGSTQSKNNSFFHMSGKLFQMIFLCPRSICLLVF